MAKTAPKIKVVVIGGGISGIATGIRLSETLGDRLELTVGTADQLELKPDS